ncbi:tetratricopeptide repeat protein [Pontibacter ummariensis]|uniref:Tetratricopeptide repeat-containing protein n=1 Tax=Pontibacter ummariensis TaxID=1610492 RepID=A0A239CEP2_9BACT|nr:J domain-containing protein [Pontibacter ummariensis]PRY15069.1 tetratricopeptide repeat protein [Pontibacter ummariensis]SNS18352.1 Tetratricopeptide repeat-containing protein [Pontibacter ummariensis]
MEHNLYNVLGISPTATAKEVKAAYKQLALKYHPDRNPGDKHAEELFKLVNTAYQTLSNPDKRARYDLRLQYQRELQRPVNQYRPQHHETRYYQTRPPASVSERYYRNIKRNNRRFSRKDWYITVSFVAGLLLFSFLLKTVMDHITGEDKYRTALTYIEGGKYSSAHRLLSDAIHFMPENGAAYEARGMIELDVYENYNSALSDLNKAIALQERPSAQAFYMRGRSLQQLAQYQQAEADLTQALQLNKKLWRAHLARGEVRLFYLKEYEDAIADFTSFLANCGDACQNEVDALTYRGFGYYKQGDYARSEQDYRKALAADKENGRLYYLLGRTEIEQQQPDSACAHFNDAYQLGYSAALLELRANCQD